MKALLLAGGESSRMGSPKHLLPFLDGRPTYIHLLQQLIATIPEAELYISLRDKACAETLQASVGQCRLHVLYDADAGLDVLLGAVGPAAGLLAAHAADPTVHWLVLACDYPLMSTEELSALCKVYEAPVTCFKNVEGFFEPFVGVWSPYALDKLKENVLRGVTGPIRVVKMLNGKGIRPIQEASLFNTNTKEEWEAALTIAATRGKSQTDK